jgi:hypothetical protein
MKKLCFLLIAVFCISTAFTEKSYSRTIDLTGYAITITRIDGGWAGSLWHLFVDGWATVQTTVNPNNCTASLTCYGAGSSGCDFPKTSTPVQPPEGTPNDIYTQLVEEAGQNIFNGTLSGSIIKDYVSTTTGVTYEFECNWNGTNIRNNTITIDTYKVSE